MENESINVITQALCKVFCLIGEASVGLCCAWSFHLGPEASHFLHFVRNCSFVNKLFKNPLQQIFNLGLCKQCKKCHDQSQTTIIVCPAIPLVGCTVSRVSRHTAHSLARCAIHTNSMYCPIHTADADATQLSSRRRCVHNNSQLVAVLTSLNKFANSEVKLRRVAGVNAPVGSRDPVYNFQCC